MAPSRNTPSFAQAVRAARAGQEKRAAQLAGLAQLLPAQLRAYRKPRASEQRKRAATFSTLVRDHPERVSTLLRSAARSKAITEHRGPTYWAVLEQLVRVAEQSPRPGYAEAMAFLKNAEGANASRNPEDPETGILIGRTVAMFLTEACPEEPLADLADLYDEARKRDPVGPHLEACLVEEESDQPSPEAARVHRPLWYAGEIAEPAERGEQGEQAEQNARQAMRRADVMLREIFPGNGAAARRRRKYLKARLLGESDRSAREKNHASEDDARAVRRAWKRAKDSGRVAFSWASAVAA